MGNNSSAETTVSKVAENEANLPKIVNPPATTEEFIKSETSSHTVVVFSKSYCPYCKKTKAVFAGMDGVDTMVHELDHMPDGIQIQDELYKITGQRTVPNVWVKGKHLGGNDDTQAALKSGKLEEMLKA